MAMRRSRIAEIEKQLAEVRQELGRREVGQQASLIEKLSHESFLARQTELEKLLGLAKRDRSREILELRLKGRSVENGTVPLYLLARFCHHVGASLTAGFVRLKSGAEPRGPIAEKYVAEANLRLGGLAHGSARLFVTGDSNADLFGFSVLEEVIDNNLQVLRNEDENSAGLAVSRLGRRSVHNLSKALHALQIADVEMDVSWERPSGITVEWLGTMELIAATRQRLESMQFLDPVIREIRGTITLLSHSGRIEIRLESGEVERIHYSPNALAQVSQLHIGQVVSIRVSEVIARNLLTGAEKGSNDFLALTFQG